jgi:hypothetical protein
MIPSAEELKVRIIDVLRKMQTLTTAVQNIWKLKT